MVGMRSIGWSKRFGVTAFLCVLVVGCVRAPDEGKSEPAFRPPPKRGYSIPLIDLAGEKDRQVIVDKERSQYLGHPTTVLLRDNKTILCVYPLGPVPGAFAG